MQDLDYQSIDGNFFVNKRERIGSGEQGIVYKGFSIHMNKVIAVKLVHQSKICDDLQRQINIMKTLSKVEHQNIMQYYGNLKLQSGGQYLFLQYCAGGSLAQLILKNQKISQVMVIKLFFELLKGMSQIHKKKIIHRDLKPENILLDENNSIKIADYGVSRKKQYIMSQKGTYLYSAPQLVQSQNFDQKCDVWSAGLILYEMLIGQPLIKAQTLQQLTDTFQRIKKTDFNLYPPEIDPFWQKITKKMLVYDPKERLSSYQLLQQFKKEKENLQIRIMDKYGISKKIYNEYDDGIRISKSIRPYKKFSSNIEKKQEIVRENRSYQNITKLRNYLNFFLQKAMVRKNLAKEFNKNNYKIDNFAKYLLMFFSSLEFYVHMNNHLENLNAFKIKILNEELTIDKFIPAHRQQAKMIIENSKQSVLTQMQKILKKLILGQLCPKIQDYFTQGRLRAITNQSCNPLEYIQEIRQKKYRSKGQYLNLYISLINHPHVYISNSKLKRLDQQTLKTYVIMRIIGNLDQQMPDENYNVRDFVTLKMQQIQNSNTQKLIAKTKLININESH